MAQPNIEFEINLRNSNNKKQTLIEYFEQNSDNLKNFFNTDNYNRNLFKAIINISDDIDLFNLMINKLGHLKLTEISDLNYSFCPNLTTIQEYHDHGYFLLYVLESTQLISYHLNNFSYTDEFKIICLKRTYALNNNISYSINITAFSVLTDHDFIPTKEIIEHVFFIFVKTNHYRSLIDFYTKYNISYDNLNKAFSYLSHFQYNIILKFLLDEGAIADYRLLRKLCHDQNLEMIKYLATIGYDLSILAKNPESHTPSLLQLYDLLNENGVTPRDIFEIIT